MKRTRGSAHAKKRGQQKIDNARTQAIQEALIREHYLQGEPSGSFDASTQKALQKYQSDHGWQTRVVPDSRALISLGLGPDHDHLLNPETAMTSSPAKPHAAPSTDQSDGQSQTQNH
jgi:peptidoglycan hydrolase-like protein with peptidoglycan-binding domain